MIGTPSTTVMCVQVADDEIYLVVNAGCREKDLAHLNKHLSAFKVCSGNESLYVVSQGFLLPRGLGAQV
jgi:aminomethyltransferase